MKPILKSAPPVSFEKWAREHPDGTWEDMRSDMPDGNIAYKNCKKTLLQDQHSLCAYCECRLDRSRPHCSRVEHFHPKSDRSKENWNLVWENLLLVCLGGQTEGDKHPLPDNLSCDASKKDTICDDLAINPLKLPPYPPAFLVDRRNGELLPNNNFCESHPGLFSKISTRKALENTLSIYNLNCNRLCVARLVVMREMENQKTKMRKNNIPLVKAMENMAKRHLQAGIPFFSTRRAYLGSVAEKYLKSHSFRG